MRHAVFVYGIPVASEGDEEHLPSVEDAAEVLAELIATEGIQREPVVVDDEQYDRIEAALFVTTKPLATLEDLNERLAAIGLTEATLGDDLDGQVVVYTNLKTDGTKVEPFEAG